MWRHIACSVQGPAHVAEGVPCQDSNRSLVLGEGADETLVACVADGAGSATHSAIGSTVACDSIMESIAAHFDANGSLTDLQLQDVLRWCEAARSRLSGIAASRGWPTCELATTLCVVIVSSSSACVFQVGDGAIVLKRNGVSGVAFWPQSGEYVNSTTFLTSKEYRDSLGFLSITEGFSDVALLTDGVERLALRFDVRIPHPPFFEPLFRALRGGGDVEDLGEDLRRFLESESVRYRSDDDKTLILASRISAEIGDAD